MPTFIHLQIGTADDIIDNWFYCTSGSHATSSSRTSFNYDKDTLSTIYPYTKMTIGKHGI